MTAAKRVKLLGLSVARRLGLFALARLCTSRAIMIVGWHGISLENEHERFTTLFISEDEFRRRLRFLTRHWTVISLDEAVRQMQSGRLGRRQVVLTFDDGYYNFLTKAAPILREFKATGTVYLVTEPMVSQQPKHNLVLRDIALSTSRSEVDGLPGLTGPRPLRSVKDREKLAADLNAEMERTTPEGDARTAFCRSIAERLGVAIEARLAGRMWHCLTPAEARQLAEEGFSMQLHTHTHQNVVRFHDAIREEVGVCRRIVEDATGREARDFCYPSGLWDKRAWPPLAACGVRSAVTTRYGPNFGRTPLLALRRYLTGQENTQLEFEFEVSGLRWLAHTVLHPSRLFEASEKLVKYKEDGKLF